METKIGEVRVVKTEGGRRKEEKGKKMGRKRMKKRRKEKEKT